MSPVHLSRHRQPPAFLPLAWLMTKRRINQKVRPNSISSFQVRSLEQNPDSKSLIPASTAAPSSGEGFMSSISWWAPSLPSERWMILDERESQTNPTHSRKSRKQLRGKVSVRPHEQDHQHWNQIKVDDRIDTMGLWMLLCSQEYRNKQGMIPQLLKTRRLVSLMLATTAGPKAI